MAASGRGDRVWKWIQAPAQVNATMGALSVPGEKYRSFDAKLAKALRTAANGNTTHQQRIQEELGRATAEEEAQNRPIRGRQLLLIVHAYYRTNEELGTHYTPRHIYMVECVNDKRLDAFLNEWHTTIARIPKTVDPDILREHFLSQMRNCACMEHALKNCDAASRGEHHRTYKYLLEQANRQISLRRQRENDAAIVSRLRGRASPAVPAQTRSHCAQWTLRGNCRWGSRCEYLHEQNRRGPSGNSNSGSAAAPRPSAPASTTPKGKGKGKGKDRGTTPIPRKGSGGKGGDVQQNSQRDASLVRPCEFSKGKCGKPQAYLRGESQA